MLLQATVPAITSRISSALNDFRESQSDEVVKQIIELSTDGCLLQAANLCKGLQCQIATLYWTADNVDSDSEKLDAVFTELNTAVDKIPTALLLMGKGLVRLVPFGLLSAAAWLFPLPFQVFWFCISAFAACACGVHLMWHRWRALQAARKAARRVATHIHREVQARAIALARETLSHQEHLARERTQSLEDRISKLIESLKALSLEQDQVVLSNISRTIKRIPWNGDQLKFLYGYLHEEDSFARFHCKATQFILEALPRILDGTIAHEEITNKLQSLSGDYCRQRFSLLSLADLLQHRLDEEARKLNSRPHVFLQNCVVNDCQSQPHRVRRAFLAPRRTGGLKKDGPTTTHSLLEYVLAVVVSVELSRLSETFYMTDASGVGELFDETFALRFVHQMVSCNDKNGLR